MADGADQRRIDSVATPRASSTLSIAPDAKVIGMFVAFTRAMYEPGRGGSEINLHSAVRSFIEIPYV